MDGTFAVWTDLLKSSPSDEGDVVYHIRAVGSVETPDQEGETALIKGMDFSYFRNQGYFNWDHKLGPENIIGEPTRAEVMPIGAVPGYQTRPHQTGHEPCVYTEGVLYKEVPRAQATWNLMQTLAKSQEYQRRLGISVEGGTLTRRGRTLERTIVQHMAITHKPVHADTIALAKSIGAGLTDPGFDFAFANVGELAKALADSNPPSELDLARQLVLGLLPCERGCHDGAQFTNGRQGMLEHFVKCAGFEPDEAAQHIIALYKALH